MTLEERAVREAIAADLRAVADLYTAYKTNDYHAAVRASYLSAADRVLNPSLPPRIATFEATLKEALDDCCEEHD